MPGTPLVTATGVMAWNLLHRTVLSRISDSDITAVGAIAVLAVGAPILIATTTAASIAQRDTAIVTSDLSALAGLLAVNVLTGSVIAEVEEGSSLDADSILISADSHDALIDAISDVSAVAATGTISVDNLPKLTLSAAMAINLIGWSVQPVALGAVLDFAEALLGVDFASAATWRIAATATDSQLTAVGDIVVSALSAESINATVSNSAQSTSNGIAFTFSGGAGLVMASNKILGETRAVIESTSSDRIGVHAGGLLRIAADHAAGIYSNVQLTTGSLTTNDGGFHALSGLLALPAHDHLSTEAGMVVLDRGDTVLIPIGAVEDDETAVLDIFDQPATLAHGDIVRLADDYGKARHSTSLGIRYVLHGDVVLVEAGHDAGGDWDTLYRYLGGSQRIDLSAEDFTVASRWAVVAGEAGSAYRYTGAGEILDLNSVGLLRHGSLGACRRQPAERLHVDGAG